jgi:hypothetical protein
VLRELHDSPEGTLSVIVIDPPNPFTAVSEIVETAEDPGATAEGELALTRKSWNLKVATVMRTKAPLVPIIVRRYVPATFELHETVALVEPLITVGLIELHVNPEGGLSVSVIAPVKPFWAEVVIVELVDWPAFIPAGVVVVRVKSGAGGPRLRNLSRHPHPGGLLLHCMAP